MTNFLWSVTILVCLAVILDLGECRTIDKRAAEDNRYQFREDTEQNIRNTRSVDVATGVKNALLGFVFNPLPASKGFSWEVEKPKQRPTKKPIRTTTEDAVSFAPGEPVSLEIPDKLFGSSFTLVTNLSTEIGDYFMNSAIRLQRLLESMRPFLRSLVGADAIVIEGPADKPIFSAPKN